MTVRTFVDDRPAELRAVWSTAYVNSLPNSSFAAIDADGNRHLPYKDKNGNLDKPHIQNALSRLSQTKISAALKAAAKKKLVAAAKKVGIEVSEESRAAGSDGDLTAMLYAPITRIDADKREIEGVLTSEDIDTFGTVFEYEAMCRAVDQWPGNVREQHDPRRAVGRRVSVEKDPTHRQIILRSRISAGAEDTWQKILDGTLAGYSVGAAKVKKEYRVMGGRSVPWFTEVELGEVSVVDAPSNPAAARSGLTIYRGVDVFDDLDAQDAAETPAAEQRADAEAAEAEAAEADPPAAEPAVEATEEPEAEATEEAAAEPEAETTEAESETPAAEEAPAATQAEEAPAVEEQAASEAAPEAPAAEAPAPEAAAPAPEAAPVAETPASEPPLRAAAPMPALPNGTGRYVPRFVREMQGPEVQMQAAALRSGVPLADVRRVANTAHVSLPPVDDAWLKGLGEGADDAAAVLAAAGAPVAARAAVAAPADPGEAATAATKAAMVARAGRVAPDSGYEDGDGTDKVSEAMTADRGHVHGEHAHGHAYAYSDLHMHGHTHAHQDGTTHDHPHMHAHDHHEHYGDPNHSHPHSHTHDHSHEYRAYAPDISRMECPQPGGDVQLVGVIDGADAIPAATPATPAVPATQTPAAEQRATQAQTPAPAAPKAPATETPAAVPEPTETRSLNLTHTKMHEARDSVLRACECPECQDMLSLCDPDGDGDNDTIPELDTDHDGAGADDGGRARAARLQRVRAARITRAAMDREVLPLMSGVVAQLRAQTARLAGVQLPDITGMQSELVELRSALAGVAPILERLAAMPMQGGPVLRAVDKQNVLDPAGMSDPSVTPGQRPGQAAFNEQDRQAIAKLAQRGLLPQETMIQAAQLLIGQPMPQQ